MLLDLSVLDCGCEALNILDAGASASLVSGVGFPNNPLGLDVLNKAVVGLDSSLIEVGLLNKLANVVVGAALLSNPVGLVSGNADFAPEVVESSLARDPNNTWVIGLTSSVPEDLVPNKGVLAYLLAPNFPRYEGLDSAVGLAKRDVFGAYFPENPVFGFVTPSKGEDVVLAPKRDDLGSDVGLVPSKEACFPSGEVALDP